MTIHGSSGGRSRGDDSNDGRDPANPGDGPDEPNDNDLGDLDGDVSDEPDSPDEGLDDGDALPEIPRASGALSADAPQLPQTPATIAIARMSERSLSRAVGVNAYQKGRGYARRGNVIDADVGAWSASGSVHGRAPVPYEVRVDFNDTGAFTSACSCPAWRGPERHCKHVAALLVALRDRMRPMREAAMAQQQHVRPTREAPEDRRGGRRRRRPGETETAAPREVVVVDRSGPRVVNTLTGTATAVVQAAGLPVEAHKGWQVWLPTGDPRRAPEFEYRIQVRPMAIAVAAYNTETRTPVAAEAAIDLIGPYVSAHRVVLRALARAVRGGRPTSVELRGEDAAEVLSLLRGKRVLVEPNLMELRYVDDPLVPKMELENVGAAGLRLKVVFERRSDGRRYALGQGLWFEGSPGWQVDVIQGIARTVAESVTPVWLERLSRAPAIVHPLDDIGRLLTEIVPKAALALGTELPDLAAVVDVVDATPTFVLKAAGDLTRVHATLRAAYGDVELDVPPAELPPPLAVLPSVGDRLRVIRRDIGAEREAVDLLFNLGLGLAEERDDVFEAAGDKAVAFWTEGIGSLPDTWDRFIPDDLVNVTVRDTPVVPRARVSSGTDWLSLDVEFESEGSKVNEDDLRRAILEGRRLVKLEDGTFAPISADQVSGVLLQMAEIFAQGRKNLPLSQAGRIQDLLRLLPGARVEPSAKEILATLADRSRIAAVPLPTSLKATLRPYQIDGFSWLVYLHRARTGGVLADDMGLGKTLETLALLVWAREEAERAPAVTAAPGDAPTGDLAERPRRRVKAPMSADVRTHGARRTVEAVEVSEVRKVTVKRASVVDEPRTAKRVVKKPTKTSTASDSVGGDADRESPPLAAAPTKARRPLNLVVAPTSVVTNWMREIEKFAPHLRAVAWTGGDREKRTHEIANADVVITSYALLRRDEEFLKGYEFAYVILDEAQNIKNPVSATARAARRLRSERRLALTGTPIENRLSEIWSIFDFLSPGVLGDLSTFEDRYARPIDRGDAEAVRRLRAVIHPLVLRRTKAEVARDLPEKIMSELACEMPTSQQALYKQVLTQVRASIMGEIDKVGVARSQIQILAGLTRLRQAACDPRLLKLPGDFTDDDSGKLDALREIVSEAIQSGHRTLVFSQFVEMLTLIRRALERDGVKYEYLDGATRDRMDRVDRFNSDETIPVFLISLKAGGSGLNLTGADTVIHFDPWWNPAVEDQATDRAHRIGQTRVVTAYRLIARNTIEEKIMALSGKKRDLVASVLGAEEPTTPKGLTRSDVEMLLSESEA